MNSKGTEFYLSVGNGKKVKTIFEKLSIDQLHFYPENPRIASLLKPGKKHTDNDIETLMVNKGEFKDLFHQVKDDNQINEPLTIYKNMVIEGNTRLLVLRLLVKKDPKNKTNWTSVPCRIIVDELTNQDINYILSNYHIKKKKDWDPYEQACWFSKLAADGTTQSEIANMTGRPQPVVSEFLRTYDLMKKNNIADYTRWSYYQELIKNPDLKEVTADAQKMKVINSKIETREISDSRDLRKGLPLLLKSQSAKKEFFKNEKNCTLHRAVEIAERTNPEEFDSILVAIKNLVEDIAKLEREQLQKMRRTPKSKKIIKNAINKLESLLEEFE